jgi:O-antigen ligase
MSAIARAAVDFRARPLGWDRIGPRTRAAFGFAVLIGIGAFWGAAVSLAGIPAAIMGVALIACLFCLRDFRAGVALLILIMPISQSQVFPREMFGITGLNPLNLLLVTTVLSLFMSTAGKGTTMKGFMPRAVLWPYLVPLAVGAFLGMNDIGRIPAVFLDLGMISFSSPFGYVRDYLLRPATFVAYALLLAAAVARSDRPERFITPLLVSVWIMAGVVLVFTLLADVSLSELAGTYARAFFSPLGMHANDLGRLYATAYALLLFVWDRTGNMALKTFLFFAMGVVVLALLLTFSRGAFLGFIIVNVIYLFSRRRVKTLVLAGLLVPVGLALMPGAVWYRVTMGFGEGLNTISAGRVDGIWMPLLPTLMESPIWGKGLGSILWSAPMIDGRLEQVAHPHNAYLQAFMDLGVVGLVLLVGFWIYMWRRFRDYGREPRLTGEVQGFFEGAAAGLLAFLIAGFAGSSLMPDATQVFLWLAVGMMYGVRMKLAEDTTRKT